MHKTKINKFMYQLPSISLRNIRRLKNLKEEDKIDKVIHYNI